MIVTPLVAARGARASRVRGRSRLRQSHERGGSCGGGDEAGDGLAEPALGGLGAELLGEADEAFGVLRWWVRSGPRGQLMVLEE